MKKGLFSFLAVCALQILPAGMYLNAQSHLELPKVMALIKDNKIDEAFISIENLHRHADWIDSKDVPLLREIILKIGQKNSTYALEIYLENEAALIQDHNGKFLNVLGKAFWDEGFGLKAMDLFKKAYLFGEIDALNGILEVSKAYRDYSSIIGYEHKVGRINDDRLKGKLFRYIGEAYLALDNLEDALFALLKADATPKSYLVKGRVFMKMGHLDSANEAFSEVIKLALELDSRSYLMEAMFLKSLNYEKNGHRDEALSAYNRFVQEFPKYEGIDEVKLKMAVLYFDIGEVEKSKEILGGLAKSKNSMISKLAKALDGYYAIMTQSFL